MDVVHPDIDRYLHHLACPEDAILREMELVAAERSFPIVGPQVGRILALLTRAIGARRAIDLGSGFGYSAYWLARAVGPKGEVVLCEASAERAGEAEDYLSRGGLSERVRIEVGDALEILAAESGVFDVVFNDVDKEQYPRVLDRACAKLRPGGLFISDNMLWFGTVLEDAPAQESTRGVLELTRCLFSSPAFETVLLPVRDGVTVSIYRGS
jgi:predicted O-methyltransferase YrrM